MPADRESRVTEAPSSAPRRRGGRIGAPSDEGVWTAALAMGFAAFLTPLWFLAAGSILGSSAVGSGTRDLGASKLLILIAAGLVLAWGSIAAWVLARAPRLVRGPHRSALRWSAIATLVAAVVFMHFCFRDAAGLAHDGLACASAALPALLMAEVSIALPAIARSRHGVGIARFGTAIWVAAGSSLMAVTADPSLWWLPLVISLFGAYCTGIAAMRVWGRYEGRIVMA